MPRRASLAWTDLSRATTVGTAAFHWLVLTAVSMYWYSKNQSCSPAMTREPSERVFTSPKNVYDTWLSSATHRLRSPTRTLYQASIWRARLPDLNSVHSHLM